MCAVTRRAHVGARVRSAPPAFGAERVARGSDPDATGAQARSAHAIGAERVTREATLAAMRALAAARYPTRTPTCARLGGSCLLAQL